MLKLTDTQTIVLSRAATRPGNLAMPLPDGLHGATAKKSVAAMISRGWLEEVEADLRRGDPLWRETGDGHGTTLIATEAGRIPRRRPNRPMPRNPSPSGRARNRPRSSRCFSGPRGRPLVKSSR